MRLPLLALAAVPLAWLVPNHYPPWPAAWPDALALALLAMAALSLNRGVQLSRTWAAFLALSLATVAAQLAVGLIPYRGDAVMSALYLVAFGLALGLGHTVTKQLQAQSPQTLANGLTATMALVATLSVGIALAQWTATAPPALWLVDKSPLQRPFANIAQPNHFCTLAFLGLAALGWLRSQYKVGALTFCMGGAWLLMGMVVSGSRTGWLQVVAASVFVAVAGAQVADASLRRQVLALCSFYAALTLAWPSINEVMLLQGNRLSEDITQGGTRPAHWASMIDALTQSPWWGYGWQQVSSAQWDAALNRAPIGEHIEHSHNLVLDLLVWNGLPLGMVLTLLAAAWFWTRFRQCRVHAVGWLYLGACGLLIHAQLEYPLDFAYFLIPLGLFMGVVDAMVGPASPPLALSRPAVVVISALFAAALAWVGVEYLKAEQAHRLLRLESSKIGVTGIQTPPPELAVLTQLGAFIQFAQEPAREGMTAQELSAMRLVARRHAYPPSMLRFALAAALNGRSQEAADTLLRLCRIHPAARCQEGRESWAAAQLRYPSIKAPFPTPDEVRGASPSQRHDAPPVPGR